MRSVGRWIVLVLLAAVLLQLFFLLRIAAMAALDPQSTTFQRSEAFRIASEKGRLPWSQRWVPYEEMSDHLKRAVIAAEDDGFISHDGVDWEAIERAWERNEKAEQQAARRARQARPSTRPPKIVGGSTITQQLAKNLLLSGERTLFRKGQEIVLTFALERMLSKRRILEIYLNSVEWGEGVFGAEAAARHYYRKSASKLSPYEAARLAVMLPAPKRYERTPGSGFLASHAGTIQGRMRFAQVP